MRFPDGHQLGRYTIRALIGKGGMGEVYRARDARLRRDVAIKVLPGSLAHDPSRANRLEREARLLGALSHPNIATIYGIEAADGQTLLVLELVEGETLEGRLKRGAIPVASGLRLAIQIAQALEAAHEKGVIHRDLKPANVKLTPDGTVKVLDFGLAKAVDGESRETDLSQLPTLSETMTGEGIILGTPAYMSPQQARGQSVDAQADIWAFGCLLYEMLTGRAAFRGDDASTTLARVLERSPDLALLPEGLHPWMQVVVKSCLEKDPRDRFRAIGDVRLQLEQIASDRGGLSMQRAVATGVTRRTLLAWGAAGVAASAAGVIGWNLKPVGSAEPVWMTVSLPPGVSVTRRQFAPSVALSPDGRTLLIAGTGEDGQRLYERRLGSLEAVPVRGTEGGSNPFFSPDGQWIGFFADGSLRRAPAAGGAATHIAAVPGSVFAANPTWGSDNRIVFATGANSPLWSATAFRRDEVERLTTLGTDELSHHFPELLPDGRTLLFVSDGTIHAFDLVGETRVPDFAVEGSAPRYIDQTGHLVLLRGAALLAAPFDAARLELTGEPLPVVEGIASGLYDSQYAISPTGTLAYVSRPAAYELVLRQPDGTERLLMPEHWFSESPRFSPDERRVAVASSRRRDEVQNIWIHDLDTGAEPWPLTTEGGRTPVWGPDGSVTFSRADGTVELRGIYQQSADGLGDPERLLAHEEFLWVIGWTPDGTLAYGTMEPASNIGGSVSSLMAFRDGVPSRVLGPGPLWGGRLSPDGRLLAYYSLDEGRFEVYVTPFPDARRRWPIAEGIDPSWAPGGAEIYYRSGNRLMAARIDRAGPDGPVTVRDRLPVLEPFLPPGYDDYHVDRDGRLVYVRPYPDAQGREVVVVQNWFTELRRRAPAR